MQSGFRIADVEPEEHENPDELPLMVGIAPDGTCFAIFWKDKRVQVCRGATRAEREAVQGIEKLILGW